MDSSKIKLRYYYGGLCWHTQIPKPSLTHLSPLCCKGGIRAFDDQNKVTLLLNISLGPVTNSSVKPKFSRLDEEETPCLHQMGLRSPESEGLLHLFPLQSQVQFSDLILSIFFHLFLLVGG